MQYLYVDCVRNTRTAHVKRTRPAYIAWTNEMVKAEEKYIIENDSYGEGQILVWGEDDDDEVSALLRDSFKEIDKEKSEYDAGEKKENYEKQIQNLDGHERVFVDRGHVEDYMYDGQISYDARAEKFHKGNENSFSEHNSEKDTMSIVESVGHVVDDIGEHIVVAAREENTQTHVYDKDKHESEHSLLDENLDELLDDKKFMNRFNTKLNELEALCKDAIAEYVSAVAMYSDHPGTLKMKEKLSDIFKTQFNMFEHTTNILLTPARNKQPRSSKDVLELTPWTTQIVEELDEMGRSVSHEYVKLSDVLDVNNTKSEEFPSFSLNLTPTQDVLQEDKKIEAKASAVDKNPENMMLSRPCRIRRLAPAIKSPYVIRVKPIKAGGINSEENVLWEWLFSSRRSLNEKLFQWKRTGCSKEQLQTLMVGQWVEGNVIDTWTHILNEREKYRAATSPLRLFCTIDTTLGALTDNMTLLDRCVILADNMEVALERANMLHNRTYQETDFDMFLFPIHKNGHHYVISFNLKYPAMEIIDNIQSSEDIETRYGSLPYTLHELFVLWLKAYKGSKWELIEKLDPVMVEMAWQTNANSVDCGIFVMRHMESFMGQPWNGWRTGLDIESVKQRGQLEDLRKMYCHDILTNALNEKRDKVIKKAQEYLTSQKKKGMFNATRRWKNGGMKSSAGRKKK
ncbi:uncharacterized protein LOC108221347 [Daucus carota subsp. sativus]|uniref:uncharacterized protein LOC108221347 n=1 Tax=Daucus carota subsp. sativus TaxID=79200 RepID=UPI003083B221